LPTYAALFFEAPSSPVVIYSNDLVFKSLSQAAADETTRDGGLRKEEEEEEEEEDL
jgi:hypothetical protein